VYAFLSGQRPLLLREGIPWDCFVADHGLRQCSHQLHDTNIHTFAEADIDARLHNAWKDVHAFSCIINVAYQTARKLSPETYNEMMISILYRLTNLHYENDPLHEAIRTGLLVFSSTIFLQRHHMKQPYERLLNLYHNALFKLRNLKTIDLPVYIVLWLTLLSHVVADKEPPPEDWRSIWLYEAIVRAGIDSWVQACEILRSLVWVDFVHSRLGQQAFEATIFQNRGATVHGIKKEQRPTWSII
jgi:hypothetical protein